MVYYLSGMEWKLLNRRYLPWARNDPPADEWRGWNWDRPPIEPPYDVRLSLFEVASQYCPTGRDVYLRRVLDVKVKPNEKMLRGKALHYVVERSIVESKRALYSGRASNGKELQLYLEEVKGRVMQEVKDMLKELPDEQLFTIVEMSSRLWDFESIQISSQLDRVSAERGFLGLDALVNTSIPFVVERVIDGSFIGLSESIRVDALSQAMVVLDLKTGKKRPFQHLYVTGYALALEAELEAPVDVGIIVFLDMETGRPHIDREFYVLDQNLRREFLEERNRKMRIVFNEEDPGVAESCPPDCPFLSYCRGSK